MFYECKLKRAHLKGKNVVVEMGTQWIGLKSTVSTELKKKVVNRKMYLKKVSRMSERGNVDGESEKVRETS